MAFERGVCLTTQCDERFLDVILFDTVEDLERYIDSPNPPILGQVRFAEDPTFAKGIDKIAKEFAEKYGGNVKGIDNQVRITYPGTQKEFIIQAVLQYFGSYQSTYY